MSIVAFDFDGTLTVRDTVIPYLAAVAGRPALARAAADRRLARALARRDRDSAKEVIVGTLLGGRTRDELKEAGQVVSRRILELWMREDTVSRLRWHQSRGHSVLIVSASLGPYLHPTAAELGVETVLCSELEYDIEGICSGRIAGSNCRGAEKVRRLEEWASARGDLGEGWLHHAYGDSAGDRAMLALARSAHRVKRRSLT